MRRITRTGTDFPGDTPAIAFNAAAESATGRPSIATITSPSFMPPFSAGLPRSMPPMIAPRVVLSPRDSASSGLMSATSTPNQPRVTVPVSMICSITFFARLTGIAKPMPW